MSLAHSASYGTCWRWFISPINVGSGLAVHLFCEVVEDNFSRRNIAEEPSVGDVSTNENFEVECKNGTGLQR